jgi:hypothetical protein
MNSNIIREVFCTTGYPVRPFEQQYTLPFFQRIHFVAIESVIMYSSFLHGCKQLTMVGKRQLSGHICFFFFIFISLIELVRSQHKRHIGHWNLFLLLLSCVFRSWNQSFSWLVPPGHPSAWHGQALTHDRYSTHSFFSIFHFCPFVVVDRLRRR